MYNKLLELPQRVIATARICIRPAMPDIERAVVSLLEARKAMQNDGHSALTLESARVALSVLRQGYLPHRDACIAAVAALGTVLSGNVVRSGVRAE